MSNASTMRGEEECLREFENAIKHEYDEIKVRGEEGQEDAHAAEKGRGNSRKEEGRD